MYYIDITGNVLAPANSSTVNIAIYKNGAVLQDLELRCANNAQPYPYAIVTEDSNCAFGDYYEVWVTNATGTQAVTLRDLHFRINAL